MLFLELPLVLVQDVLEEVILSSATDTKIHDTLRLRGVNRFFEREVTKFFARNCLDQVTHKVVADRIPRPFQIRLVQEYVGNNGRRCAAIDVIYGSEFSKDIHLAVDFLTKERQRSDALILRHAVLLDVCESLIRAGFHYKILGVDQSTISDNNATHIQSTCFVIAIIMQWSEVQNVMMRASDDLLNSPCRYLGYPIEMAIRLGDTATVRMLAEAGAEIDETSNGSFKTTMEKAASSGHAEVINYFLHEMVPGSRYPTVEIWSVAGQAAAHEHPNITMAILAKHGHFLNKISLYLMFCRSAADGSNELMRKLLEYDFLDTALRRTSALRQACQRGHLSTCKLLLESFTDDEKYELNHDSICNVAFMSGKVDILEFLIEHGIRMNNELWVLPTAATHGQLNMAKYAVSRGFHEGGKQPEPRNQMKYSETSLYFSLFHAIRCDELDIVQWLIKDLGLHPDGLDRSCIDIELTPLAFSIDLPSVKMAKQLVALGATPRPGEFPGKASTLTARRHRKDFLESLRIQLKTGNFHTGVNPALAER